jgi:hypothetical protein
MVREFPHSSWDLMKSWYKLSKHFKTGSSNDYPIYSLQYVVATLCRIYEERDAHKFKILWVPLIHYVISSRSSFNLANILSSRKTRYHHGKFPNFHMSSYLLDMMCVMHAYRGPGMRWAWQSSDPPVHIYCKVLWKKQVSF